MKHILTLLSVLFFLQGCGVQESRIGEILQIQSGTIAGELNQETGIYSYKGIPFAKAPVDSLRWRSPQPVDAWQDTLNATEFGPICMQPNPQPFLMWTQEFIAPVGNMSEDCLNLNVWTKEGPANAKRPVIVFIHGGGFSSGSNSVPIYYGEKMAQKDVVFVTINYRVGALGFMAHPELTEESPNNASGNYGLLDQVAALEWVQHNIAKFGGDPGNVTIAGQSAGSFSINYLVASPLAEGLFHNAIAESGAALLPTNPVAGNNGLNNAEKQGQKAAQSLGADSISELRSLPADSILTIQQRFSPIVDGNFLPEPVYQLFKSGDYNDVPVITGWNADEGNFGGPIQDTEQYRQSIHQRFGESADEVLQLFPADNDSVARQSQLDLGSLLTFGLQSWKWMKVQNETGQSNVYLHHFTRNLPYTEDQQDYGAFHTGEVPYAYNTLQTSDRPWNETDRQLAETMSSYWVSFAEDGNPNGDDLPEWPSSQADEYPTIYFGDSVEVRSVPSKERLQLLDKIFSERLN